MNAGILPRLLADTVNMAGILTIRPTFRRLYDRP